MNRSRLSGTLLRSTHWKGSPPTTGAAELEDDQHGLTVPEEERPAPRLLQLIRSVMLATRSGPLRHAWWLTHEALVRLVTIYLRGGDRQAGAYVRGSLAIGDPLYGISDVDLAILVPSGESRALVHERFERRWMRLRRRLPTLCALMVGRPKMYDDDELAEILLAPTLTHGLGRTQTSNLPTTVLPATRECGRQRSRVERPGLYGPLTLNHWRHVGGRDRRPPVRPWDSHHRRIAAWMEVQFWWLQAFRACSNPSRAWSAYSCVKLLTEPARIWLWLVHGERVLRRRDLIERAIRRIPQEEQSLARALELLNGLKASTQAPLEEALSSLMRMTGRIAARIADEAGDAGTTEVRLLRDGRPEQLIPTASAARLAELAGPAPPFDVLPLVDWRARVGSSLPDESFALISADPTDAAMLGALALGRNHGAYAALRADDVLVLPSLTGARLRAAQCAQTDPVSFALAEGRGHASFPDVPGWSAQDSARRAAAEHLAWMHHEQPPRATTEALGKLFTAARAAMFLDSLDAGDPTVALTVASTAAALSARVPASDAIVSDAHEAYRVARLQGQSPHGDIVARLRAAVMTLPAYAPAAEPSSGEAPRRGKRASEA